jgi:hypothetical protein
MTTSGTYAYSPPAAEVFAAGFSMIGVRRPELTVEHISDATYQANMLMVDFSNRNPNQWALETQQVPLTPAVNVYTLTNRTIAIGAAYISITVGGTTNDRLMAPMSATEYAAIPIKTQQGFPNSYWVNLAIPAPKIHIYYTPDSAYTYTLNLVTFRQMQDISPANGQNLDAPYRFLDAFTTGLAARLAINYPDQRRPTLPKDLEMLYEKRSGVASAQDQENVNLYVIPGLYGYFR